MIYKNNLAELLSVHDFNVDRSIAETLYHSFKDEISCKRDIHLGIFSMFDKFNPTFVFIYDKSNGVSLEGIRFLLLKTQVEDFMLDTFDFIFNGSDDYSDAEWKSGTISDYDECFIRL